MTLFIFIDWSWCSSGLCLTHAQTNGRRDGRCPCHLTSSNIFMKSVSSVLGLFSPLTLLALFFFFFLLHSPAGHNVSLPAFRLVCFGLRWEEKKAMYNSQSSLLFNHTVTHHGGFCHCSSPFIYLFFSLSKVLLNVIFMTVKTDSCQ